MVLHQVHLEPLVSGVAAARIAANPLAERGIGLLGDLLVACDVADLLIIAERDQIIGVGGVLVARMDRQETLRRRGRRRIFAVHIIGQSDHQLRAARQGRIGTLAPELVDQARKSVEMGKSVSVRVVLGGRRIQQKKKYKNNYYI